MALVMVIVVKGRGHRNIQPVTEPIISILNVKSVGAVIVGFRRIISAKNLHGGADYNRPEND
jgi:metal-dependent hydrolase (beta-lactamase superfamily II)